MALCLPRIGACFEFLESFAGFDKRTVVAVVKIAFFRFSAPVIERFVLRLFVYLFSGITTEQTAIFHSTCFFPALVRAKFLGVVQRDKIFMADWADHNVFTAKTF